MKFFYSKKILKLSKATKRVYFCLFHINKYQKLIQVTHQQIADKLGLTRITVIRAIKKLEDFGIVLVFRGQRKLNYNLNKEGKITRNLMVNIYQIGLQNKKGEVFFRKYNNLTIKEEELYKIVLERSCGFKFKRIPIKKRSKEFWENKKQKEINKNYIMKCFEKISIKKEEEKIEVDTSLSVESFLTELRLNYLS